MGKEETIIPLLDVSQLLGQEEDDDTDEREKLARHHPNANHHDI